MPSPGATPGTVSSIARQDFADPKGGTAPGGTVGLTRNLQAEIHAAARRGMCNKIGNFVALQIL